MVFWPVLGVFRKRERWFFFQVFSIGPPKRFWGVAMSDFDFTPLSIHPTPVGATHFPETRARDGGSKTVRIFS